MEKNDFFKTLLDTVSREYSGMDSDSGVWRQLLAEQPRTVHELKIAPQIKTEEININRNSSAAESSGTLASTDMASLAKMVKDCHKCNLRGGCRQTVFGEGNYHADLLFGGEAPGAEEDATGRPFVGKSGQLLDKMIQAMQFQRSEVFIGNIVKCRPPGNRNPMPEEADACIGYLKRQIELIKPKVLVLLGATPLLFLMNISGIKRNRGKWLEYNGIPVMPTFHPDYLLHSPGDKRLVWEDLKAVMRLLGKDPAATVVRK